MNQFNKSRLFIVIGAVFFVGLVVFLLSSLSGGGVVNPYKDTERDPEEGRDYAAIYRHGDLFQAVEENESVLSQIRLDLLTFARTTQSKFADSETLVGFTFNKGFDKEDKTFVYHGHYYGVGDKIQVKLTPFERGVYTLSITNLADDTNIDEFLSLNGKRNRFIQKLPIENDYYSVRFQLSYDRVVVTFYDGYTAQAVDEVSKIVTDALGDVTNKDVVYSINSIGIVSMEQVRQNLITPLSIP